MTIGGGGWARRPVPYIYIYKYMVPPPPKIYLFWFFTGIYVVLQQVRAFPQNLIFQEGDIYVCIYSFPPKTYLLSGTKPFSSKKVFSLHVSFFLVFIVKKLVLFLKKHCPYNLPFISKKPGL